MVLTKQKHHEVCFPPSNSGFNYSSSDGRWLINEKKLRFVQTARITTSPVSVMMLAKVPCVESLEEKFSRQKLDDGFRINSDCFGQSLRLKSSVVDCSCPSGSRTVVAICNRASGFSKLERNETPNREDFNSNWLGYRRDSVHLKTDPARNEKDDSWILSKKILKGSAGQKSFVGNLKDNGVQTSHSKQFQRRMFKGIVDEDGSCSSSDDEVSKFFFCKSNKISAENTSIADKATVPLKVFPSVSLRSDHFVTVPLLEEKEINSRKRIRAKRGSLRKKLKLSRPCLDMDKMLAHRFESFS